MTGSSPAFAAKSAARTKNSTGPRLYAGPLCFPLFLVLDSLLLRGSAFMSNLHSKRGTRRIEDFYGIFMLTSGAIEWTGKNILCTSFW